MIDVSWSPHETDDRWRNRIDLAKCEVAANLFQDGKCDIIEWHCFSIIDADHIHSIMEHLYPTVACIYKWRFD